MRLFTALSYVLLAPAAALAAVPLAYDLAPLKIQSDECEYEVLVPQTGQATGSVDAKQIPVGYAVPFGLSVSDGSENGFELSPGRGNGASDFVSYAHMRYKFKPRKGREGPCTLDSLQSDFDRGAFQRFARIQTPPFEIRARVGHLHGTDLGLPWHSLAPTNDTSGDLTAMLTEQISPAQAELLGKKSNGHGRTDVEFQLMVEEQKVWGGPSAWHQMLLRVHPMAKTKASTKASASP
jgi:hypothetical protein